MSFLPSIIQSASLIEHYGYAVMLFLSIPEGPIVAVIAGFFVSLGYLNPYISFVVLVLGDLIGDSAYYALGRWGGHPFINRWGAYFKITEPRVSRFKKLFLKHDWKIILLSKTQAVGSAILFSAGFARMPFWSYIFYNAVGTVPKVILFEIIGVYFGRGYASINTYIGYVALASFGIAILLFAAYWWIKGKLTLE